MESEKNSQLGRIERDVRDLRAQQDSHDKRLQHVERVQTDQGAGIKLVSTKVDLLSTKLDENYAKARSEEGWLHRRLWRLEMWVVLGLATALGILFREYLIATADAAMRAIKGG